MTLEEIRQLTPYRLMCLALDRDVYVANHSKKQRVQAVWKKLIYDNPWLLPSNPGSRRSAPQSSDIRHQEGTDTIGGADRPILSIEKCRDAVGQPYPVKIAVTPVAAIKQTTQKQGNHEIKESSSG